MRQAGEAAGGRGRRTLRAAIVALLAAAPALDAATYLPLPDAELVARAPVVVRGRAGESAGRIEGPGQGPGIVTVTDFEVVEVLKGWVPSSSVRLVLPGGQAGDQVLWIPGRPRFVPGQEALLFLAPIPGSPGEYGTTEFGLSVFDVLEDPAGRRFAVRSQFQAGEEEVLDPAGGGPAEPDHVRDLDSFLAALRVAGGGERLPEIRRAAPAGPLRLAVGSSGGARALWVNIGGPEGGASQFKWFWTTGAGCTSPSGVVRPAGTQSNLTDGSNGLTHLQNAASQWSGVPGAVVRYGYSSSSGNVTVNLDVDSKSGAWSAPMDCSLGVIGLGGPSATCAGSFSGYSFYACSSGEVWMRRSTCSSGYTAAVFRSAVLHEVGHTLGLGHPDTGHSVFDPTNSSGASTAVMRSSIPSARPDTPQADDVAGIQFYYGSSTPPPAPVASFGFSPASPTAGQTVAFTDLSTNAPTSWSWTFGDGGASTSRNPAHAYASAGTYGVSLTATNASGSGTTTRTVTVAPPAPPVADFGWSPASPAAGQTVAFADQSSGGPTSWSWSFGDGTAAAAANPAKSYAAAGSYTVSLQVSNALGSSSRSKQVVVSAAGGAPVASFTFAPVSPVPGQSVQFTDTSTGGPTSWRWDFGDGSFSSTPIARKAFGAAGTYPVSLSVSNSLGSSTVSQTITVTPSESERVVPIVLDAFGVGSARFRSELVLVNRGTTAAALELTYTAASSLGASGSGTVAETLGAGRQLVLDDALAYLRSRGLSVPQAAPGASQGGTLRVRFRGLSSPDAGEAFARTTALLPEGRAGVAYPGVAPSDWLTPAGQHVFGLRESSESRSNLALVNLSSGEDVGLRVTVFSGEMGDRSSWVYPETVWLRPLQWTQLGALLARAGYANGWVRVERAAGAGPFYAYGVFNDYGTNDGSFIDPVPVAAGATSRMVPVVLELGIYSSELILTNPNDTPVSYALDYVESYSRPGVPRQEGGNFLQPREQRIVEAIPHLRALAVDVGPFGGSYAGSVVARFTSGGEPANGFVGARAKSPGRPQGSYGVYYSGLGPAQAAAADAWVYGLRQDGESRTNVAVAHAGPGGEPVVLQAEVFDGETGASRGGTGNVTLAPGQWFQWNQLLSSFGLRQGYARVFRVSGSSRFLAYGVVNDGGTARGGTNDGSYVPMIPGR